MGIFSNKKEKLVAIFDIGSGSVGGALVRIPKNKRDLPTIIKSTRTDIVNRKEVDFDLFLNDMVLALGFTSQDIYQSKLGAPDEIICVLASPWYLSETRMIKMSKEHSFTFTKKVVNDLLLKEVELLNKDYKEKYNGLDSLPEIIEHPIVGISLNGYQVDDPLGKRTKSLEMSMIISLCPKICLDSMTEIISKSFHDIPISFSSFMLASYVSVRDRYMNHDSYLLLDVGGEVTDMGIIYKGVLKQSLSFPYGRKTLYRDICNALNIELRDAVEIFSLYSKNTLSEKEKAKISPVLDSISSRWVKSFKESIDSLPRTLTIPNVIFLTIDSDVKDWFMKIINSEDYVKSMILNKKFTIVSIDGPEFLNMCSVKDSYCDPFLMIESINVARRLELYE